MEILGKLAWTHSNSSVILSTPPEIFHRILDILLIPDCELSMVALDALYNLSLFGREVAELIAGVRGLVEVLLRFLFFRVENLTPEALSRIKLYFIGDSSSLAQYLADIQAKSLASSTASSATSTATIVGANTARVGVPGRTVTASVLTNQIHSKVLPSRVSSPLATNQILSRSLALSQQSAKSASGAATPLLVLSQALAKGGVARSKGQDQLSSLYSILSHQSQTGSQSSAKEELAIQWSVSLHTVEPH